MEETKESRRHRFRFRAEAEAVAALLLEFLDEHGT